MNLLIYRLDNSIDKTSYRLNANVLIGYRFHHWKPSLRDMIPPGKNFKYILYALFHFLGIFKNNYYSSLLLYKDDVIISSLLIVPAYYRWPFMGRQDVQLTYVMTNINFRGQELAYKLLKEAIYQFKNANNSIWYITDDCNASSIKLCEKADFALFNKAVRKGLFKRVTPVST